MAASLDERSIAVWIYRVLGIEGRGGGDSAIVRLHKQGGMEKDEMWTEGWMGGMGVRCWVGEGNEKCRMQFVGDWVW